jgi:pumilio RNA-binding family
VALRPQLRVTLLTALLNECLMEQSKGDVLLHHCFIVLPHEDCKVCAYHWEHDAAAKSYWPS